MKLTKIGKIILLLIIIVIGAIIVVLINTRKNSKNIHVIESNEFLDIKIDYNKTGNKKLDNEIKNYVEEKRKSFIEIVDKAGSTETSKYNFVLSAQNNQQKDIEFVHLLSFAYTGGAHYVREDKTYVYDLKSEKYLTLKDFLIEGNFEKLKPIILEYIYEYGEKNEINLMEDWVNRGTEYENSNYEHFYLNGNGLNIIFVPYQIASWADGEIKITIPYYKLEGILKEEYLIKEENEDNNSPTSPNKRDLEKYKDKKLIAFTFDDGPNTSTTSRLLDGIKEFDARVTFFVLGSRVESHSDVLKRAYEEGNLIGTHTYNHLNLLLLSDNRVLEEINDSKEAIKNIIGNYPTYLRPPYGNINEHIKGLANMYTINWDVDTEDWKLKNRDLIKDKILEDAHDGAIVLLHDIYTESVEGTLLAMKELEKQNYAFVTVEEMVQLRGVNLDYETTYYNFRGK